jgi:hypothetical protein
MTEAEARADLQRMTAWDSEPALTVADVDRLVVLAKRPDALGRNPSDPLWTPTFALRPAAAEGWRWKAAKAAALYDVAPAGSRFDRRQMYEHAVGQVREYESWGAGGVSGGSVPVRSIIGFLVDGS